MQKEAGRKWVISYDSAVTLEGSITPEKNENFLKGVRLDVPKRFEQYFPNQGIRLSVRHSVNTESGIVPAMLCVYLVPRNNSSRNGSSAEKILVRALALLPEGSSLEDKDNTRYEWSRKDTKSVKDFFEPKLLKKIIYDYLKNNEENQLPKH